MKLRILFLVAYLFLATTAKPQSTINDTITRNLSSALSSFAKNGMLSGNVLVAQDNKIVFHESFGLANYEWKIANTLETKMYIASISKQFTSTLILRLVQEGLLELNTPIVNYIPQLSSKHFEKITIHQLLSHTSGLPRRIFFEQEELRFEHTDSEKIEKIDEFPLLFEPGSDFSYSNIGYYLLHLITEAVTNKKFESLVENKLLKPIGLEHTGFMNNSSIVENMASGYSIIAGYPTIPEFSDISNSIGAGGMYSTTHDLYLWDQALRNHIILDSIHTEKLYVQNKEHYGYGWKIKNLSKKENELNRRVEHNGDGRGFASNFTRYLESNFVVIILGNHDYIERSLVLTYIIRILNDLPVKPVVSVANGYYKQLLEKNIDFENIKSQLKIDKEKREALDIPNYMDFFNQGSKLYNSGRKEEALNYFRFMIHLSPDNYLGYFALGQHYLQSGQIEEAKKYLMLSLERKPNDQNIIKLINETDANNKRN
ncbi:serine hydrolase [Hanstruepera marina]|uniref:serine hydrolase n=1 Tax=Hanstruepera marina TaxID=2873265 RepID=UPI001CA604AD|nr:serine hydrolase [Hanstruepera marina]